MEYGRFVRTDIEMDDGGVRAIMRFDAEAINDIAGKVDAEVFDLIAAERGYRKQDVDVAALRELADSLVRWVCIDGTANDVLKYAADRFVPNNAMPYLICNGAVMQAIIASIGGGIRKAIDGVPELDPFASAAKRTTFSAAELRGMAEACAESARQTGTTKEQIEACFESLGEREAAADWVEAQGGLDAVRVRMAALDDFISDVAEKVGVPIDEKGPMTIYGDVIEELDKRLMPCDLVWPMFSDGKPVTRDDAPEDAGAVALALDGSCYWFEYDVPDLSTWESGERVLRAKPAMLGADGMPFEVGQTVYDESGGIFHVCALARDGIETTCGYLSASSISHTPPDTQERIDEDKRKNFVRYWGCSDKGCGDCRSLIDGEKPYVHFGVVNCSVAQGMDIARREQTIKARTMGGAR